VRRLVAANQGKREWLREALDAGKPNPTTSSCVQPLEASLMLEHNSCGDLCGVELLNVLKSIRLSDFLKQNGVVPPMCTALKNKIYLDVKIRLWRSSMAQQSLLPVQPRIIVTRIFATEMFILLLSLIRPVSR
jgi:ribosomal protein L39E